MKTKTKKCRAGTVIFFSLYVLGILAFFVGLHFAADYLKVWLTNYEAAQPTVKCAQIFEQLFAQPDWEALYRQAGCEDTEYESATHYRAYMEQKQVGRELHYHETSAGLSNDKKYVVTLGKEKVAAFTLTAAGQEKDAIPDWQLGEIELFFTRQEAVQVLTSPDCTVYINGVALTDEHTVQVLETAAEEYLPGGVHGLRKRWVYADGLLVPPEVTAVDADGQPVELTYDTAQQLYAQSFETTELPQEDAVRVTAAAKTYCRYMIRQESRYNLSKVFDENSEIFKTIIKRGPWSQELKSYRFTQPEFSGYYRYSDTMYSVMLKMSLHVTSTWGAKKEFPLDYTFIMQQQEDGKWLVYNMTNVDVQQTTTKVRLTYVADGKTVLSEMVDAAATALTTPAVAVPEGKEFAGWYRMETGENGKTVYTLTFMPNKKGTVALPGEPMLESMTLYALYK